MKHALIDSASKTELAAAIEAADWLLDAVACSTQDRRFLRGDPDYDDVVGESIILNGRVAAIRAMRNAAK